MSTSVTEMTSQQLQCLRTQQYVAIIQLTLGVAPPVCFEECFVPGSSYDNAAIERGSHAAG